MGRGRAYHAPPQSVLVSSVLSENIILLYYILFTIISFIIILPSSYRMFCWFCYTDLKYYIYNSEFLNKACGRVGMSDDLYTSFYYKIVQAPTTLESVWLLGVSIPTNQCPILTCLTNFWIWDNSSLCLGLARGIMFRISKRN